MTPKVMLSLMLLADMAQAQPPNVLIGPTGNYFPAPGYKWVTTRPRDLRVVWEPGQKHPEDRRVVATKREGLWTASLERRVMCLQSVNYPDAAIGARDGLGVMLEPKADKEGELTAFRLAPGLADSFCVSFQSVRHPLFYLRHRDGRIRFEKHDGSALFRNDATFVVYWGFTAKDKGAVAFGAYNFDTYLRHRGGELWMDEPDKSELFGADASFIPVPPKTHVSTSIGAIEVLAGLIGARLYSADVPGLVEKNAAWMAKVAHPTAEFNGITKTGSRRIDGVMTHSFVFRFRSRFTGDAVSVDMTFFEDSKGKYSHSRIDHSDALVPPFQSLSAFRDFMRSINFTHYPFEQPVPDFHRTMDEMLREFHTTWKR